MKSFISKVGKRLNQQYQSISRENSQRDATHCPKNKLNLNIKTEPVMDVEDATVQNGHK